MIEKLEFIERFVFSYDASFDGFGIQMDLYEMFHVEAISKMQKIYENRLIKMTEQQFHDIIKMMNENNEQIEIIVFYELNKEATLAFFGEDYVELTNNIYDTNNQFLKRNNYKEIETKPEEYNWAKNNLKIKFLRHQIVNI